MTTVLLSLSYSPAPESRRYLPRTAPAAAAHGATTATTPASYGYRNGVAAPRRGGHPQQQPPAPHTATQFRREVDDRGISDAGRDRAHAANGGGYPMYEATMDQDTFGFMAPCWRLLQRAKAYMDQVGILEPGAGRLRGPVATLYCICDFALGLSPERYVFPTIVAVYDRNTM